MKAHSNQSILNDRTLRTDLIESEEETGSIKLSSGFYDRERSGRHERLTGDNHSTWSMNDCPMTTRGWIVIEVKFLNEPPFLDDEDEI